MRVMRRQAVLILVIAAALVAIILLRPKRGIADRHSNARLEKLESQVAPSKSMPPGPEEAQPPGHVLQTGEDPNRTNHQAVTGPLSSPSSVPGREYRYFGESLKYEVTILNSDGHPVVGAEVIIFRTSDLWKTYEVKEVQADAQGKVWVIKKLGVETVLLHSYKKGEGAQFCGLPTYPLQLTMTYVRPPPMKLWCRGEKGDLRSNTHLQITPELNHTSNRGERVWLKYPVRSLLTDEYGKLEVEGLPYLGSSSDGTTRTPGCRFTITATCDGRSAEMKFDDYPMKETVHIIIE